MACLSTEWGKRYTCRCGGCVSLCVMWLQVCVKLASYDDASLFEASHHHSGRRGVQTHNPPRHDPLHFSIHCTPSNHMHSTAGPEYVMISCGRHHPFYFPIFRQPKPRHLFSNFLFVFDTAAVCVHHTVHPQATHPQPVTTLLGGYFVARMGGRDDSDWCMGSFLLSYRRDHELSRSNLACFSRARPCAWLSHASFARRIGGLRVFP